MLLDVTGDFRCNQRAEAGGLQQQAWTEAVKATDGYGSISSHQTPVKNLKADIPKLVFWDCKARMRAALPGCSLILPRLVLTTCSPQGRPEEAASPIKEHLQANGNGEGRKQGSSAYPSDE